MHNRKMYEREKEKESERASDRETENDFIEFLR